MPEERILELRAVRQDRLSVMRGKPNLEPHRLSNQPQGALDIM